MRAKTIAEHPDLKYILAQLKKGTPQQEIVKRVNKRAKGPKISRYMISRFIKDTEYIEAKVAKVEQLKNEGEKIAKQNAIYIEKAIEEQLEPADETLDYLFDYAVDNTQSILIQAIQGERKMADYHMYIDALRKLNDLRADVKKLLPSASNSNSYEQFILDADYEEVEGDE